jgi:hypothetical protein
MTDDGLYKEYLRYSINKLIKKMDYDTFRCGTEETHKIITAIAEELDRDKK